MLITPSRIVSLVISRLDHCCHTFVIFNSYPMRLPWCQSITNKVNSYFAIGFKHPFQTLITTKLLNHLVALFAVNVIRVEQLTKDDKIKYTSANRHQLPSGTLMSSYYPCLKGCLSVNNCDSLGINFIIYKSLSIKSLLNISSIFNSFIFWFLSVSRYSYFFFNHDLYEIKLNLLVKSIDCAYFIYMCSINN